MRHHCFLTAFVSGLCLASGVHAQPASERWAPEAARANAPLDALVFATGARASSEYSGQYGAATATGRPNVWPQYGDKAGAWAPNDATSPSEWLEVSFPATETEAIYVFESCNAGAIRSVVDGDGTTLYETTAPAGRYSAAQVLAIRLPTPRTISKLRITVDGSLVSGWAEIDAVGLRPTGGAGAGAPVEEVEVAAESQRWEPKGVTERIPFANLVFAAGATASSQYSTGNGAAKATGRPDVWPKYGDRPGAWAAADNSAREWLEVSFPPTSTRWIYIFETCAAGTIRKVVDDTGGVLYRTSEPPAQHRSAQVLAITLREPRTVTTLKILIDGSLVPGWTEIDAVALGKQAPGAALAAPSGPPPPPPAAGGDLRADLAKWRAIYDPKVDWEETDQDPPETVLAKARIQGAWFVNRKAVEGYLQRAGAALGSDPQLAELQAWGAKAPKTFMASPKWVRTYETGLSRSKNVTRKFIADHRWVETNAPLLEDGVRRGECLAAFYAGFGDEAKARKVAAGVEEIKAALHQVQSEYDDCVREFHRMPEGIDAPEELAIAIETVKAKCKRPVRGVRVTSPKKRRKHSSNYRTWTYDAFDAAWAEQREDGRWAIATATVSWFPKKEGDYDGPHEWQLQWWSWSRHVAEDKIDD